MPTIDTPRLRLRAWRDDDLAPFAALNADPRVMEHFPAPLTRAESDALVDRIRAGFAAHGFGLWATEVRRVESSGAAGDPSGFVGFVGLSVPNFDAPFLPCVEVGWRLAAHAWGHGYATEAARAVLAFAFDDLGLPEVVSFTAVGNVPSQRVMERLGLRHRPDGDFEHPALPPGHPLRPHVLYTIDRQEWRSRRAPPEAGPPVSP